MAIAFLRDQMERLPSVHVVPSPFAPFLFVAPDAKIEMPLLHIRVRQIANTWHAPRDRRRLHEGQDIFAPKGTPVYSSTDGIVVRLGDAGIGGNAVSVLGRGGRIYYYAHLSRFADGLRVGEIVTPETLLGNVGNTGNARTTPPHLHFGVYGPNGAMNPLPLLTDRTVPTTDVADSNRRKSVARATRS
jgi:murein DD-endopeptidase MepM/ murein hydrolase activator NlpD